MRHRFSPLLFLLILTFVACIPPQSPPVAAAPAPSVSQPPLIDRNLFFDDPKIASAQISPDGRFISFRKPYKNVMNIWIKGVDESFDAARPLTADTDRPVRGYFWSQDGRYILYVQDKGGNENFHVYAVDPAAAADPATGVPPARDLTPMPSVRAAIYAVPENTPNEIIVGINDRDPALHDVYRLDLTTGERTLLIKNEMNVAAWITDLEGNVRLAFRQAPDGTNDTYRVENGKLGKVIYSCAWDEECSPIRFHKNGKAVYAIDNKGVDLARLVLLDPETGETTIVESDPEKQVDFGNVLFSDRTEELMATVYRGDRVRIYPKTPWFENALSRIRAQVPHGELSFGSMTNDDRLGIIFVNSDVDPGSAYLFNAADGQVTLLYDSRPDLPKQHLAPMKAVRYKTRDGWEIPAYLTTPKGVEPRNLPVVLVPHGGPWARDFWGYDSWAQFLANRGYASLMMNFRGSTGYGKKHLNAGNKQWGTGIMQHDISDAVKYLVESGIADPKRVAIMGGSYGGYATLAGLTFTPDLYAAGVSIVGPSNLFTLLNSIPPYWAPMKKMFLLRMGDPAEPADKAQLEAQSPFFHAKNIKAPLLVIQGANDPRVKKAESDQIVVALRDLGRDVEYVVAPDEGHGFAGRENRLAMMARIEQFLADKLGGRHQADMPPDISQKLASIQVDVAKVEMPKLAGALDLAKTDPLPLPESGAIVPATLSYKTLVKGGGREINITGTRTVASETLSGRAVWRVTSATEGPMSGTETYVLDALTLRPLRRSAKQGAAAIDLEYGEKAVTGSIQAGPQQIAVDLKSEAPLFGDSSAIDTVIPALPLKVGYRTTFRTADIGMQQRVRYWSLSVPATEPATVAAGTFDTFKVVVEPLDGEGGSKTYWISTRSPRFIVKSESQLPMGGTASSELVSRK